MGTADGGEEEHVCFSVSSMDRIVEFREDSFYSRGVDCYE